MNFTSIFASVVISLSSVSSAFAAEPIQCRGGSRQEGCAPTTKAEKPQCRGGSRDGCEPKPKPKAKQCKIGRRPVPCPVKK